MRKNYWDLEKLENISLGLKNKTCWRERNQVGEMGLSGTFFVKFKYCALVQEGNCVKVEKFSENKYERYM